jgi:hypothetical protein
MLLARDGSSYGTFETNLSDWWPGMEFRGADNQRFRICAIAKDADAWIVEPVEPGSGPKAAP